MRKGDAERGALLLIIASRGRPDCVFERWLDPSGAYVWRKTAIDKGGDSAKVSDLLARRARFDPDLWAVELDVAEPERFIVQNLPTG